MAQSLRRNWMSRSFEIRWTKICCIPLRTTPVWLWKLDWEICRRIWLHNQRLRRKKAPFFFLYLAFWKVMNYVQRFLVIDNRSRTCHLLFHVRGYNVGKSFCHLPTSFKTWTRTISKTYSQFRFRFWYSWSKCYQKAQILFKSELTILVKWIL